MTVPDPSNALAAVLVIEAGDVFLDRETGETRLVASVSDPYADCGSGSILLADLADPSRFERVWPSWKAAGAAAAPGGRVRRAPVDTDSRPVLLSPAERRRLDGIAASMERRNFRADAQLVRDFASRWDGAVGLIVVQETAAVAALSARPLEVAPVKPPVPARRWRDRLFSRAAS